MICHTCDKRAWSMPGKMICSSTGELVQFQCGQCPDGKANEVRSRRAIKTPTIDLTQRQVACQSCLSLIEFEDSVDLDERGSLTVRCEKKRCPRKRVSLLTERCPDKKW